MAKLLLVEDDTQLAIMIAEWLRGEHHAVELSHDGKDGYERLACSEYDLVILDWDLPGMTGMEICQQYRSNKGSAPIIILTGHAAIGDKVTGFDSGADDYITKPFHMKELSVRVKALLRRGHHLADDVLTAHGIILDPTKFKATKNGVELSLLPKEFALLEFLMRNPETIFTNDALFRHVWRSDSDSSESAIRTCIKRLRQKIDEAEGESIIETIHRVGYRMRR